MVAPCGRPLVDVEVAFGWVRMDADEACGRARMDADAVFGWTRTLDKLDISSKRSLLGWYNDFCRAFEVAAFKGRNSALGRIVVVVAGIASDRFLVKLMREGPFLLNLPDVLGYRLDFFCVIVSPKYGVLGCSPEFELITVEFLSSKLMVNVVPSG